MKPTDPLDLHTKKAMELFQVGQGQVTPEQRRFAKQQNYVERYRGGPRPLSELLKGKSWLR